MQASAAALPVETFVEVAFPAWPMPVIVAAAIAPAAPREWATEREAGAAAAFVAGLVGVPAFIAVGAIATTVAVGSAVLLAPVIPIVLAWVAWRANAKSTR